MRRGISSRVLLLVVFISAFMLTGCGGNSTGNNSAMLQAQRPSASEYTQVNLVSSSSTYATAKVYDSNLVNPWGIANGPTTPIWVANQATSTSTVYSIDNIENGGVSPLLVVNIAKTATAGMQGPTGIVFNPAQASGDFMIPMSGGGTVPAFYIFDNLNGTISCWNKLSSVGPAKTYIAVTTPGAMYKGLAAAMINDSWYLFAADATPMGGVRVFDSSFHEVTGTPLVSSPFIDPDLPALPAKSDAVWTTFNIENDGANLFVTFAPIPVTGGHPILNSDAGVVAEFTTTGKFVRNVIVNAWGTSGRLDDPWGIVMAPGEFGKYSDALLVGNFGNGEILAYRPNSDGMFQFEGTLDGTNGAPFMEGRLWDLAFGNGVDGADPHTLYLTTGGPDPTADGLFAAITPAKS